MGTPPPADAPPVEEQEQDLVDAGFAPGPPAASLCGFVFPTFTFHLKFNIPFPPPFPFPPKFFFSFGLNCDLNNPLALDAGASVPGGGRVSTADPDPTQDQSL
jgi:hypothetical protein